MYFLALKIGIFTTEVITINMSKALLTKHSYVL